MFDYELFAPDAASMDSILTQMSMRQSNSGKVNGTIYATDYYGTKFLPQGTPPTYVAQPGAYCNIRWMGTNPLSLTQQQKNAGYVLSIIAAPFYRIFAPVG